MRFLPVCALAALLCTTAAEATVQPKCVGTEVVFGTFRPNAELCPPLTPR